MLCNFLVWSVDPTIVLKKNNKKNFWPQKFEKNTLKWCSENLKSTLFSLLPWLPKPPQQKNSCSKMWPIDQLYIELGGKVFMIQLEEKFEKLICYSEKAIIERKWRKFKT